MKLIACVNNDWAIGKDNHLLYHIKEDMEFFKNMTMNNIVIMERETLKSLPYPDKGLPNRTNIIMSKNSSDINPNYLNYLIIKKKGFVNNYENKITCKYSK